VAGLVAITPACGFVNFGGGLLIGALSGVICYYAIHFKHRAGYDDALDVVGVHGVGGLFGAIATGVFATTEVNNAVTSVALKDGRFMLILHQIMAVGAVGLFSLVVTFVLAKVIEATIGLRASSEAEEIGMDEAIHGESGYGIHGPIGA
jgi:Amt family ammonium transporter